MELLFSFPCYCDIIKSPVEPVVGVSGIRERVVAAEVVAGLGVLLIETGNVMLEKKHKENNYCKLT